MGSRFLRLFALAALPSLFAVGCNSPYYADKGALMGGLGGAGIGALAGNALGNTGAGAAIGAATGLIAGSAIGSGMDNIEARNRAEIEARLGRPMGMGSVTIPDVIAMTQAAVSDDVIISHIQANGFAGPLQASDLIYLQQQGVSARVVQTLQAPPVHPVVMQHAPVPVQPVIVEEYYYPPPYYHHPYRHHRHRRHRPGVSWGVSVAH